MPFWIGGNYCLRIYVKRRNVASRIWKKSVLFQKAFSAATNVDCLAQAYGFQGLDRPVSTGLGRLNSVKFIQHHSIIYTS